MKSPLRPGRVPAKPAEAKEIGAIAQLGERYNGIVEVTGSIPVGSTNKIKGLAAIGWALCITCCRMLPDFPAGLRTRAAR